MPETPTAGSSSAAAPRLTKAAEQAFFAALSATGNARLSAAATASVSSM